MITAAVTPERRKLRLEAALRTSAIPLAAIAAGGAWLRLRGLAGAPPNEYYDAAVRSMGLSWHNFFFGAYEPGGSVAIDKPPVDLWLQVASVKLFGFGTRSLILPQALASVAAIPLLYDLVRRVFGRVPGLVAAAALAVLPISVLTARSDTMDSLAMALGVLAAWLVVRAATTGRVRHLVLAGAVCGLAFEVKLFEGLLVVPALALLYWLAAPLPRGRRARDLGLAATALTVLAIAWPAAVSLAPTHSRPYPLGSSSGSVWDTVFVYNGLHRITGERAATPLVPAKPGSSSSSQGGTGSEAPGPLRLFDHVGAPLGTRVGIELVAALLLGGLALAARVWTRDGPPEVRRLRRALAASVVVWIAYSTLLYCAVSVLQVRYLEVMSPAVAIALGIGIGGLARVVDVGAAARAAAAVALVGIAAYAVLVEKTSAAPVAAVLTLAAAAVVLVSNARRLPEGARHMAVVGTVALTALGALAVPARKSVTTARSHASAAGKQGSMSPRVARRLSSYLRPRTRGVHWEFATATYNRPAPIIVRDVRPVLVLTGVARQPIVPVSRLRREAERGRVRYALVGGGCGTAPLSAIGTCPATVRWIRSHAVDVTHAAGFRSSGEIFRLEPNRPARRA